MKDDMGRAVHSWQEPHRSSKLNCEELPESACFPRKKSHVNRFVIVADAAREARRLDGCLVVIDDANELLARSAAVTYQRINRQRASERTTTSHSERCLKND